VCVEENVKILSVVGSPNEQGIKKTKELGFTIIFWDANPTVAGAKAAEAAGADIIVTTGFGVWGLAPSN